jgi:hypothetical protein
MKRKIKRNKDEKKDQKKERKKERERRRLSEVMRVTNINRRRQKR